jgi:predicted DNA-binding mobile mystery protein A
MDLKLRQLEAAMAPWRGPSESAPPPASWLRAVREALGMTASQLARRMRVSKQTVAALERGEARRSATLASLARAADAMDADLVYAIVPRGPLAEIRSRQARKKAERALGRVGHSMRLEAQDLPAAEHEYQVAELEHRLVREWRRSLWDDDA